ncbi:MAG: hypothetical protein WCN98_07475, partial [Verrucomicrobiaceae bacterium]
MTHNIRGNALAPILLIIGALAVSGLVFFFFTRQQLERPQAENIPSQQTLAAVSESSSPVVTGENSTTPAASVFGPKSDQGPATSIFAKPTNVGEQFTQKLATGDLAGAAKMLSPNDPEQAAATTALFGKIIQELGYKPSADEKVELIGQVGNTVRISIPLSPPTAGGPPVRLTLDLERDSKTGWKVTQMHLPKELGPMPASLPADGKISTASPTPFIVVDSKPDALSFASDFVH